MRVVFEKSNFGKNCWNLMLKHSGGGGIGLASIKKENPAKYRVSNTLEACQDIYVTSLNEAVVVAKGIVKNTLTDVWDEVNLAIPPIEEALLVDAKKQERIEKIAALLKDSDFEITAEDIKKALL